MDRHGRVEAVVQSGSLETRYVRIGRGSPVLILRDPGVADAVWDALFERIASSFRAIEPRPVAGAPVPGGGEDGTAPDGWLRGLIDGLGLDRPGVVTGPGVAATLAGALAGQAGELVGRTVVLAQGGGPSEPSGTLRLPLDGSPLEDIFSAAAGFLAGPPREGPSARSQRDH